MSDTQKLEKVQVQPYHWEYEDKYTDDDKMQIRAWCLDKESVPYLIRIEEFPVYFFVELPLTVNRQFFRWTTNSACLLVEAMKNKIKDGDDILPYRMQHFGWHQKLYFYRGDRKYPMVMVLMKSMSVMYELRNKLKYPIYVPGLGQVKCNVHESTIDPILKLLVKTKITHTSWLGCMGEKIDKGNRISTLDNEYIVRWQSIHPLSDEQTKGWSTSPGIMAWDIECYCDQHKMFPDKLNEKHVAYMISCIYQRVGSKERHRYGIILGDCKEIPNKKFANTELFKVNTEEELVRMFCAIIKYHDAEILTGHNILGFDYPYLNSRLEAVCNKWPNVSRLKDFDCYVKSSNWSSGAYGVNNNNILQMPGRISIDLHRVVSRNYKLPSYSLSNVSKYFINKDKHDITAEQMFIIYEHMVDGINKGKGTKIYDKAMDEMTDVMLYCIQDSELVIDVLDKIYWWIGAKEMAGIVGANVADLSTRGQQMRCVAQLYRLASNEGYIMDYRPCPDIPFTGGFVGPPTPGLIDNVFTFDFKSLYPTIMQGYNICYSTFIPPDMANKIPDSECNIIHVDCSNVKDPTNEDNMDVEESKETFTSTGKRGVRVFKFYKKKRGLLPELVAYLCDSRNKVRAILKNEKDPVQRIVLDKRQLALKVSANSFFGFLGVRNGAKFPLIEGAMAITAWGRQLIHQVNRYLIDEYEAVIVYGDTDSSMVTFPKQITHPSQCKEFGDFIAKKLTELFPPPIEMEFEDAMRMLSLMKKKYAGLYIGDDGEFMKDAGGNYKIKVKGILPARRDNCKWFRDVYNKILKDVLLRKPYIDTVNYIVDQSSLLISGKVPRKDLEIVRTLGSHYKSKSYFMKVFSDELRKIGKPAQPGEKLWYIIIERPGETLLGKKMATPEMYIESMDTDKPMKIDYLYYLGLLQNQIDQLIGCGYREIISKINYIRYRPTNRHGYTNLSQMVKMISRMYEFGEDPTIIKDAVKSALDRLKTKPKLLIMDF